REIHSSCADWRNRGQAHRGAVTLLEALDVQRRTARLVCVQTTHFYLVWKGTSLTCRRTSSWLPKTELGSVVAAHALGGSLLRRNANNSIPLHSWPNCHAMIGISSRRDTDARTEHASFSRWRAATVGMCIATQLR